MQTLLSTLKDVPGVLGSFVLNNEGQLLAREMPAVYPDSIFPELGRRLASVSEVVGAQTGAVQELLLKFDAYFLHIRCSEKCSLSVVAEEGVNYPALKMATNVAMRQVVDRIGDLTPQAVAGVAAAPVAEPAPTAPAAPAPAAKPRRFWRGQAVD